MEYLRIRTLSLDIRGQPSHESGSVCPGQSQNHEQYLPLFQANTPRQNISWIGILCYIKFDYEEIEISLTLGKSILHKMLDIYLLAGIISGFNCQQS